MAKRKTGLGRGWTPWSTGSDGEFRTGRMGYSYKGRRGHADVYPVQGDRTRLTRWVGVVWEPGDRQKVIGEFEGDGPRDVAVQVEEVAS